jgi:hypothetical protein
MAENERINRLRVIDLIEHGSRYICGSDIIIARAVYVCLQRTTFKHIDALINEYQQIAVRYAKLKGNNLKVCERRAEIMNKLKTVTALKSTLRLNDNIRRFFQSVLILL